MTDLILDGFMLNPNEKIVNGIRRALERNGGKCPCHHPENDGDLTCPCESYRLRRKCCCNLYVLKDQDAQ